MNVRLRQAGTETADDFAKLVQALSPELFNLARHYTSTVNPSVVKPDTAFNWPTILQVNNSLRGEILEWYADTVVF